MTPTQFLRDVTLATAVAVSLVALVAMGLADRSTGLGVVAGGALVVGNLWWLAAVAASAAKTRVRRTRWAIAAALRLGAIAAAFGIVLASGAVHPIGVVVGLAVLPCALVVQGLRGAGDA